MTDGDGGAGDRGRRLLEELTGDPAGDDALLAALEGDPAAYEHVLRDRQVPQPRLAAVEAAYERWRERTADGAGPAELATRGALGFWLMTMRMLRWTGGRLADDPAAMPEDERALHAELNRLLADGEVRRRFVALYDPPADLDRGSSGLIGLSRMPVSSRRNSVTAGAVTSVNTAARAANDPVRR